MTSKLKTKKNPSKLSVQRDWKDDTVPNFKYFSKNELNTSCHTTQQLVCRHLQNCFAKMDKDLIPAATLAWLFRIYRLPEQLRPGHREPWRHRRPGDRGRGQSGAEIQRGRQVCHHHAGWETRGGIQPQADVAIAQRHHQEHPGRHRVPGGYHLQERPPSGAGLDQAHHHRQARPRRPGTDGLVAALSVTSFVMYLHTYIHIRTHINVHLCNQTGDQQINTHIPFVPKFTVTGVYWYIDIRTYMCTYLHIVNCVITS